MRPPRRTAAALATLTALASCNSSAAHRTPDDGAHAAAVRWVAALNADDAHTVGLLTCPDEGFRAAELATVRTGTHLGPYRYRYFLQTFGVLTPTRASADIDQRLTATVGGRTRVSDLPRSFSIVRRNGRWLVCPGGTTH